MTGRSSRISRSTWACATSGPPSRLASARKPERHLQRSRPDHVRRAEGAESRISCRASGSPGRPATSGTTSIRGGFGINYDKLFDNLGVLSLPPQLQQTVDVGGLSGSNFLANGGIKPSASAGTLSQADARANTAGFVPDQKLRQSPSSGISECSESSARTTRWKCATWATRGISLPVQQRINTQPVVNAQNALPLYYSMPSQAQLNSLSSTLGQTDSPPMTTAATSCRNT